MPATASVAAVPTARPFDAAGSHGPDQPALAAGPRRHAEHRVGRCVPPIDFLLQLSNLDGPSALDEHQHGTDLVIGKHSREGRHVAWKVRRSRGLFAELHGGEEDQIRVMLGVSRFVLGRCG
jgi:hypothetical protein